MEKHARLVQAAKCAAVFEKGESQLNPLRAVGQDLWCRSPGFDEWDRKTWFDDQLLPPTTTSACVIQIHVDLGDRARSKSRAGQNLTVKHAQRSATSCHHRA